MNKRGVRGKQLKIEAGHGIRIQEVKNSRIQEGARSGSKGFGGVLCSKKGREGKTHTKVTKVTKVFKDLRYRVESGYRPWTFQRFSAQAVVFLRLWRCGNAP
jgi:hypothetical protein